MTKMDESTQNYVKSFATTIADKWLFFGEPYKIYYPIVFNMGSYFYNQLSDEIETFPKAFSPPLLTPSVRTIIKGPTQRMRLGNGGVKGRQLSQLTIYSPAAPLSLMKELEQNDISADIYNRELSKFKALMEKGKPRRAYIRLNQLIRYNPFDIKLIQQRVRLEKVLGKDEYRKYDLPWISVLMELEKSGFNSNKKP